MDRAVEAYPDPDAIIERNIATVRALGLEGWRALLDGSDAQATDGAGSGP